mmetsp:Transcript_30270/g.75635  ORF Transcript_30270/g.75635 Transcript_30270/m.75635 type:complete len:200 (+) Transcript_30270:664-1263(+)
MKVIGMSITFTKTVVMISISLQEKLRNRCRTSQSPKMKRTLPAIEKSWFCKFCTPAHTRWTSGPAVVPMLPMAFERNWKRTTSSSAADSKSFHPEARKWPSDGASSRSALGFASLAPGAAITTRGSSMRNHETKSMAKDGMARMAQTVENEIPREKVPSYSGPFIPRPTRSCAQICPMVRTRYAVVCVLPRVACASRLA